MLVAAVNAKAMFCSFFAGVCRVGGAASAKTLIIVDGAGSHQANILSADSPLGLEKLPPYAPELNPAERFFQELRKDLANQIF